jgi:predicted nucleic acid-binding protein
MMPLVLDASALVAFLVGRSDGAVSGAFLTRNDLHVPAICDVEVVGAISKMTRQGSLLDDDAQQAIVDYVSMPLGRHLHTRTIARCYELRDNFSAADASYVALAEALDAALVTIDRSLARAVRAQTSVAVLSRAR